MLFSQELILGEFTAGSFSLIVIASVLSSVVGRAFFGNAPAFATPPYAMVHHSELALYVLLGVAAAFLAFFFVRVLYRMEDIWDAFHFLPPYVKPVAGGVLIGVIGLYAPQIFGVGYETIEAALRGEMVMGMLAILVLLKMLATSLTIGSGGSGGVFAPSLYIGAMFGGAFGMVIHSINPAFTAASGAYALVGMGAVFAGVSQAPMTAIVMLFELTQDYRIILPLMISCVISATVAGALSRETIYTLKLLRRGVNLRAGRDINIMRSIPVVSAMVTDVETVLETMTVGDIVKIMQVSRHTGFPVLDEAGRLAGIVTLQDIRDTPLDRRLETPVSKVMTADLLVGYPDESLNDIAQRFGYRDVGRLPIVARENPSHLVGLITRSDIIKAYNRAIIQSGPENSRTRLQEDQASSKTRRSAASAV